MKSLLVVGCLFLAAAAVRAESIGDAYVELMKEHIEYCATKNNVAPEDLMKPDMTVEGEARRNIGCTNHCVLEKMGVMDGPVLDVDKIKTAIVDPVISDSAAADKEMAIVKECAEAVAGKTDECEVGFEFVECTMKKKV